MANASSSNGLNTPAGPGGNGGQSEPGKQGGHAEGFGQGKLREQAKRVARQALQLERVQHFGHAAQPGQTGQTTEPGQRAEFQEDKQPGQIKQALQPGHSPQKNNTPTPGQNTPRLRFPGYENKWEEVELGSVLKERKEFAEKDGSFEHATLSKDGIYGKTVRFDRDFLVTTENKKYKVTHINDLCYNPANLKFGVICLNKYGDAIFSPIYVTFEVNKEVNADFIGASLTQWDFINRALRYQQGTVYERMSVSPEDFLSLKCYLPSLSEQRKIAGFFELLDQRISL